MSLLLKKQPGESNQEHEHKTKLNLVHIVRRRIALVFLTLVVMHSGIHGHHFFPSDPFQILQASWHLSVRENKRSRTHTSHDHVVTTGEVLACAALSLDLYVVVVVRAC